MAKKFSKVAKATKKESFSGMSAESGVGERERNQHRCGLCAFAALD
jgi:hypothetical protein